MTLQQRSGLFSARARLTAAGLSLALVLMAGVAAPSMAENLGQDLGIIRACGSDVWSLCKDVLPDIGRIKAVFKTRLANFPKVALTSSSTRWPAGHSRSARIRLMRFVLRRAAMCTTASPTVSAT